MPTQILRLLVKGNYRHRIIKLGAENSQQDLSEPQQLLKEIAYRMPISESLDGLRERPSWSNNAFVYLAPLHAAEIQEMLESGICLDLQSKHVLVSEEYKDLVKDVLAACPKGAGRELFLTRRAGVVVSEEVFATPRFNNQKTEIGDFPQFTLPRDLQFCMEIDGDLLDFMTSPGSVQSLQPEMHVEVWTAVCEESRDPKTGVCWLEMRDAGGELATPGDHPTPCDPKCPFCTRCGTWAASMHLSSAKCRSIGTGGQPRPLLDAIIAAVDAVRERGGSAVMGGQHWRQGPLPEPEHLKFRGCCPKPGCWLRIAGRVSGTHCCKRCAAAHLAGVDRLPFDPETGQRWQKRHGPECTMHQRQAATLRERGVPASSFTGSDAAAPIFTPTLAPTQWQ